MRARMLSAFPNRETVRERDYKTRPTFQPPIKRFDAANAVSLASGLHCGQIARRKPSRSLSRIRTLCYSGALLAPCAGARWAVRR